MASHPKIRITPDEYLALERRSEQKSEYFGGEIFAMGGASPRHVLIVTNIASELRSQLKSRDCLVYAVDLRLRVAPTGLHTYPDVVVVCGPAEFDDSHADTLLNPVLIVEVLSESTKNYDRGEKFEHYRSIDSFREYVLVAQDRVHVERNLRQGDGQWLLSETSRIEDSVELVTIGCQLPLSEAYAKVRFSDG